jgi:hypothetical protein
MRGMGGNLGGMGVVRFMKRGVSKALSLCFRRHFCTCTSRAGIGYG